MKHPRSPSSYDIRTARNQLGLTLEQAAFIVYTAASTWKRWEYPDGHPDHSDMHPAIAELFALKTGLKPLVIIPLRKKDGG